MANSSVTPLPAASFRPEQYLLIWLSSLVAIVFCCLNLYRYVHSKEQRTQLTYVYHCSLGFSLLLSLVSSPLQTLTDYLWSNLSISNDRQRQLLCNFYLITFFIASAGIGYSMAYASLERTLFLFYSSAPRLTWSRQFTPIVIIFFMCSVLSTLIVLLTRCSPLDQCQCFYHSVDALAFHGLWLVFQFLLPFLSMLISIGLLLYHIELHLQRLRTSLNRKRSRKKFHRILVHLTIYNCFYFVAVCPLNLYAMLRFSLPRKQRSLDVVLNNAIYICLHLYPLLIFLLGRIKSQRRIQFSYEQQRASPYVIVISPAPNDSDEFQRTKL